MIEAYCGRRSYLPGQSVAIHVSSNAGRFSLIIARDCGSYEIVHRIGDLACEYHPVPGDAVANGCRWPVAVTVEIDRNWKTGFYRLELHANDGSSGEAFFVLREPRPAAPILWVIETNTWNAYNSFGGANTYTTHDPVPASDGNVVPYTGGAPRVSFQRPLPKGFLSLPEHTPRLPTIGEVSRDIRYAAWSAENGVDFYSGPASWANWDLRFARWALAEGIEVDYATSADLEEFPHLLDGYVMMLSVGHDEYWSWAMRDAVETFIAKVGNVAFLSGNVAFWQVRIEHELEQMVAYKGRVAEDPVLGTPDERRNTGIWSHHLTMRPENIMSGLSFTRAGYARVGGATPASAGGYTIYRHRHWALEGTGLSYGDQLGATSSIVGYETDGCDIMMKYGLPYPTSLDGTPDNFEIIGIAPATAWSRETAPEGMYPEDAITDLELICLQIEGNCDPEIQERYVHGHAVMGSYVSPGRGTVFSAGTTEWVMALDDPQVAQITRNVLRRLGAPQRSGLSGTQ